MQSYLGDNLDSLASGFSGLMSNGSTAAGANNAAFSAPSSEQGSNCGGGGARTKERDLVFCSFNQDST